MFVGVGYAMFRCFVSLSVSLKKQKAQAKAPKPLI